MSKNSRINNATKNEILIEVDGESQSSQLTSVHKHITLGIDQIKREHLDISTIEDRKGNRKTSSGGVIA